jgi:hypothetical protein
VSAIAASSLARRSRRLVATRFVRRVAGTSDAALEGLDGVRARVVVGAVFRLIPLGLDRRAARRVRAAVEWRITEPDGGAALYTLTVRDGRAAVRRRPVARPDLVLELSTADFLRLVAGLESGPRLFSQARLRIAGGDLELAMRLPRLFRVPRAASGPGGPG